MSRFNEVGGPSGTPPAVPRAIMAVVSSVALVTALGLALARVAAPESHAALYAALIVTELVGVALPALWLARAGGHAPAWLFRLRLPPARSVAPTVVITASAFVLASSLEAWTQRLFGPLPVLDWEAYAPSGGLELAAALVALAAAPAAAEELLYRGYVLRAFERLGRPLPVSILVGTIFASAHLSPGTFPAHLFLGSAITWVVMTVGSIYAGMAIHAASNGLAIVLWRSELVEWLPGSPAANLVAAASFAAGVAWLSRRPLE